MIWFPRFLSFATGFLSLSQEILWMRLAGFVYKGVPQVFAFTLGMYLLGIMLGAAVGKRYCQRGGSLVMSSGVILAIAAAADLMLPWFFVLALRGGWLAGLVVLSAALIVTAALKSAVFPIAHHLGSSSKYGEVGSSVSKVYFANIVGSTLGPLVTGFVLLDVVTLQQAFLVMTSGTFLVSMSCFLTESSRRLAAISAAAMTLTLVLIAIRPGDLVEHAALSSNRPGGPIVELIENRHGIIHTQTSDATKVETVFGGNVYDGTFNTDPVNDNNVISRLYIAVALHPEPRRLLLIGLSGGAWARAALASPRLQHVDAIEINPGYLQLIARRPALPDLLSDPRVSIHIDDGRRWLKRHPGSRYDLIVMNTTFHWRAYSSFLLSEEFMSQARTHLNPGGIFAFNGTGSADAFKTAASVFGHVYRYRTFVIASDRNLEVEPARFAERLAELNWSGTPAFRLDRDGVARKVSSMQSDLAPFQEDALARSIGRPLRVITEQNMITEFRYGAYHQGLFLKEWP